MAAVLASLALGLLYAELVNHRFPGRGIVRTMLITPFLVMPVAAGLTWKNMMLNPNFGVVDWLLRTSVPGNPSPNWLGHFPEVSVVGVLVWRWSPFMMLILLAGMQSISEEVREAARVDGASGWRGFWEVTFPLMLPVSVTAILIRIIFKLKLADIVITVTSGGPGGATDTVTSFIYREYRDRSNVGYGTLLAEGKEVREIDGRHYVLELPLRADVALVKAHVADEAGNLTYRKTARNFGPIMAAAATTTVVQVTEVVPVGGLDPENVVTPAIYVDRVVRVTGAGQ